MMKAFISYSNPDGLATARNVARHLRAHGHEPWLWEDDKKLAVGVVSQTAEQLSESDIVYSIVTESSITSTGQRRETNLALLRGIPVVVIVLDGAAVPLELAADAYEGISSADGEPQIDSIASRAEQIRHDYYEALDRSSSPTGPKSELIAANTRLARHVARLNGRRHDLRVEAVNTLESEMESAYLESRSGRTLLRVDSSEPTEMAGFVTVGMRSRLSKADINDRSYAWSFFAKDIGRHVASRELRYAFDIVSNEITQVAESMPADASDLDALARAADSIVSSGQRPDRIILPVGLLAVFYKTHYSSLEWTERGEYLQLGSLRLQIIWSSKYFEVDSIFIFDSNAGTWRIIPDPLTGKALTIGVGLSELFPDEVEFICQTRVKLEVSAPEGFRRVGSLTP